MNLLSLCLACGLLFLSPNLQALSPQDKQFVDRLSGGTRPLESKLYEEVEALLATGNQSAAIEAITADSGFLETVVRDFASPLSNRDFDDKVPLNDFIATFMGYARDGRDARGLLFEHNLYGPATKAEIERLEATGLNYSPQLQLRSPQRANANETQAGVLTSHAWAEASYGAGTNRRGVDRLFSVFLCKKLEDVRSHFATHPDGDFWVGRDVPRAPSGSTAEYQNKCRGCHAGMDAMRGAFSNLHFENDLFRIAGHSYVFPKYHNNRTTFPDGFATKDASWRNLWAEDPVFKVLGFPADSEGSGVESLGKHFAYSTSFAQCLSRRALERLCSVDGGEIENSPEISKVARGFEASGFKLKTLFGLAARSKICEKSGRIKTHREIYQSLYNHTGVATHTDYKRQQQSLPRYGKIEEFNGPGLVASLNLVAETCGLWAKLPSVIAHMKSVPSGESVAAFAFKTLQGREPTSSEIAQLKVFSSNDSDFERACVFSLSIPKMMEI